MNERCAARPELVLVLGSVLASAAGCGRVGFGIEGLHGDATDAITPLGAFGPVTIVPELAHAVDEDDPTFTSDILEIVFDSSRLGGDALFHSTRMTQQDAWGVPVRIDDIVPSGDDTGPGLSADGLTLMFASTRAGGAGLEDIWMTTRPDRTAPWSLPVPVTALSGAGRDTVPQVTLDGLEVFFASERAGGAGTYDLYVATRTSSGSTWGAPSALTELNTSAVEIDPHFCEIENALYFASDRAGTRDIYRAYRTGNATFDPPEPVVELMMPGAFETDPWLSPDGRTLYMVTNMSGNREIVEAHR